MGQDRVGEEGPAAPSRLSKYAQAFRPFLGEDLDDVVPIDSTAVRPSVPSC